MSLIRRTSRRDGILLKDNACRPPPDRSDLRQLQAELTRILKTQPFRPLLGRTASPARVKIW